MLIILPPIFVLIGLFEVWVPRKVIEKHVGEDAGIKGIIYSIILSSTTVGGIYVALPVSAALFSKGMRLRNIFIYLGCSSITRLPMSIFEASFLGIEFTIIRWITSIPLVLITSYFLEKFLIHKNFKINTLSN